MRRPITLRVIRDTSARTEDGFTIVEMMVATAVILIVMTALAYVGTSSLTGIAFSKQRQTANQLLGRAMEQVRALPFQTVANGLASTDSTVTGDSNISVNGSTWTFGGTNETIPHGTISGTQAPFVPHKATSALNGTTYTTSAYPTNYAGLSGTYRVTVIVSWTKSLNRGVAAQVSGQTIVYSPTSGCLSSANHPFSAPCQPFLHATATTDTPSITLKPASSGNAISGIDFTQATVTGVKDQTAVAIEQTSNVLGTVNTTGGTLDMTTGTDQATGTVSASSSSDNDPGTTSNTTNSGSVAQSATAINASSGGNGLTLTPSSTDAGTTVATATASSSPACTDLAGTTLISSLPCGSGNVSQSGTTMAATMSLTSGGAALGTATLASIASQPAATPTRVFAARLVTSTGGYCTTTSGDGCVLGRAQRSFGTVAVAGLPANTLASAPTGWGGASCNNTNALVSLANYSDRVTSESGVSPAAPTTSQVGGTLYYWNGSGCTSRTVNWGTAPPSITIPSVTVNSSLGGGTTITVGGTVTLGATETATNTNTGCVSVCTASATVTSPLVADLTYVVHDHAGNALANLELTVNLGDLAVTTTYQAAPS
jgi:prepilin-type N-terminal cleavage/methylation domain-containing protein